MEKRTPLSWLRFIAIAVTLVGILACSSGEDQKQINLVAPDFSLRTIEGREIHLKDYRGKKTVHLTFWATWCPSCLMEIPKLKELYKSIGNRPLEILSIDVGLNDSPKRVRQTQEQYQIPYIILFDENGKVSQKYGIIGVPTHIVINQEGKIIGRFNQLPTNPSDYFEQFFPKSMEREKT